MVRIWSAMLATVACLAGMPAEAKETRPLDKGFRIFLDMFPGEYDNAEQVAWAEQEGVPADARHDRIHHLFLPAFGQHVFFVQQWLDNDPSKVYRLRPDAFVHRPECDVFWRRPGGRFAGEMKLET